MTEERAIALFRDVSAFNASLIVQWEGVEDEAEAFYRVEVRPGGYFGPNDLKGLMRTADEHGRELSLDGGVPTFT